MKSIGKIAWKTVAAAFAAVFSVLLWTFWLALAAVLVVQVWWLASREVTVPRYALRAIEQRLAATGLTLTIGKTAFDPAGHILIEDIAVRAPSFNEPLFTARSAYIRVNPWDLAIGNFEPLEIRVSDLTCLVPAMMSSTGRAEPLLRDLTATIIPGRNEVNIPQLTARLAGLDITLTGTVRTDAWPARQGAPFPFTEYLVAQYPQLSKRLAGYSRSIAMLDAPRLDVQLEPSPTAGAIVRTSVFARGFSLTDPWSAQATGLAASTVIPLRASGAVDLTIDAAADRVKLPGESTAEALRTRVQGTIRTDTWAVEPASADVTVAAAHSQGLAAGPSSLSARRAGPRTLASVLTRVSDTPVAARANLDVAGGSGRVEFETAPTAALLAEVSRVTGSPLDDTVKLGPPPRVSGTLQLEPGWKLGVVAARVEGRDVEARGLKLDSIEGDIRVDGTRIEATGLMARLGQNTAGGSYEMDTASRDYRFLLRGHLQPLDISPWFHEWWPNFFGKFGFSQPPDADVDVQGRWGSPHLSTVFVAARVGPTTIRDVPFDTVQTRLFIRPDFYDALDFRLTRGAGVGTGTFTRSVDLNAGEYRYMDFAVDSTLDEQSTARIFGQGGADIVAPFRFGTPPQLRLVGHLDGPAAANGEHQRVHVEGRATGPFSLYDFPLSDPVFTAELKDDDLLIEPLSVHVAAGTATGRVHRTGRPSARQLEFAVDIKDARLGPTVEVVGNYIALRNNTPAPSRSALVEKAADSRLDLSATAKGSADDVMSYHGTGQAEINGAQLGEVRLLGELSKLLSFTSLRFTKLQTGITIDGSKLVFPSLKLSGANSEVEARGAYGLDTKRLDFLASVSPFGRSQSPLVLLDTVLKPLTAIFEVELQGTIDEPKWALTVSGPNETLKAILENAPPAVADTPMPQSVTAP